MRDEGVKEIMAIGCAPGFLEAKEVEGSKEQDRMVQGNNSKDIRRSISCIQGIR